MTALSPYRIAGSLDYMHDSGLHSQRTTETAPQPFVSLLEFASEIYQVSMLKFFWAAFYDPFLTPLFVGGAVLAMGTYDVV